MKLLRPPVCTTCGSPLPIVKVWWKADTARGFFLITKTGVSCPNCGSRFIILQSRVVLVGAAIYLCGIALVLFATIVFQKLTGIGLRGGGLVAIILPLILLVAVVHFRISPLFARVRLAENGEEADFPLSRYRRRRRFESARDEGDTDGK